VYSELVNCVSWIPQISSINLKIRRCSKSSHCIVEIRNQYCYNIDVYLRILTFTILQSDCTLQYRLQRAFLFLCFHSIDTGWNCIILDIVLCTTACRWNKGLELDSMDSNSSGGVNVFDCGISIEPLFCPGLQEIFFDNGHFSIRMGCWLAERYCSSIAGLFRHRSNRLCGVLLRNKNVFIAMWVTATGLVLLLVSVYYQSNFILSLILWICCVLIFVIELHVQKLRFFLIHHQ